jgi:general L-amino acid transport system substrate-binding protein
MMKRLFTILFFLIGTAIPLQAQEPTPTPIPAGPTLNSIRSRGEVLCGVNQSLLGFGYLDPNTGEVTGFDIDFCRSLAAAIFGDPRAVQTPIYSDLTQGLNALNTGQVDILIRNIIFNLTDDARGFEFGPPNFFSGQGILVRAENTAETWADLSGQTICLTEGGSAEEKIENFLTKQRVTFQSLSFPRLNEAFQALQDGRCDALSADRVELAGLRQRSDDPSALRVWEGPDKIYALQPYAPIIRSGDSQWSDIVSWTFYGLVAAEQLGVSSENVTQLLRRVSDPATATPQPDADYLRQVGPDVARLLDPTLGIGAVLGLEPNFMLAVIREVGNYGEIYNRHLGPNGDLPLERGLNNLWTNGGMIYSAFWK